MINEALKAVAVVGAGGKMGSGISLLLLQEMARLEAEQTGGVGMGAYRLLLIDANGGAFIPLRHFLKAHVTRYAEKQINLLRRYYADNNRLVSNQEIIEAFVTGAMDMIQCDTDLAKANHATLIFEAIAEDIESKVELFKRLASAPAFYFSNTSSIPIHLLNDAAGLQHRLIGFHFYNPPAVQKLVELIIPSQTDPQLVNIAQTLGKRLDKHLVHSRDVAGFIGNGHFLREIMYACEKVHEISREFSLPEALYIVNKVTQDFLIRPMGIFQLIDYVGIDICHQIGEIMNRFLPDELLQDSLIDEMIQEDLRGGQFPDGSQKDGFFAYEGASRKGIYAPEEQRYLSLHDDPLIAACDKWIGPFPEGHASWKHLQRDPERHEKLAHYFQNLFKSNTRGAALAQHLLLRSREIAQQLVASGVAQSDEDVDTVLEMGFFHLYGPNAPWIPALRTP